MLDGCIESMTKENEEKPLNENEKELLTLLQTMKKNQDGVAQKLMTQIAYGKEQLAVHADADEAGRLRKAFDTAWKRASNGDDRNAADLLKTELSRAQDLRRSEKGTPEQRKFAKDLKAVRDAFGEEGIIAEAPLTNLLERSLRKSGWSVQLAKDLVKRLTTQPGVKAQWNLLGPLLRAMSDQIDGVETSRQDLLKAIKKFKKPAAGPKILRHRTWPKPNFALMSPQQFMILLTISKIIFPKIKNLTTMHSKLRFPTYCGNRTSRAMYCAYFWITPTRST